MSKKELIRITAIDLFAARGYYSTSTPMIAEAAQISTGTVYNYFKNKEEILDYIFSVEYEECEAFLSKLDKMELPVVEKIGSFIDKYYAIMLENPNSTEVITRYGRHPANRKLEYVDKTLHKLPLFFTSMLEAARRKGEIPELNPYLTGPAIFYTISGMVYSISRTMDKAEYNKAVDELKKFIASALQE